MQKNCLIFQKELLAIKENLREFKNILSGNELIIWTDHKNITYKNTKFSWKHVLKQRLKLKEFGPKIKFIERKFNI